MNTLKMMNSQILKWWKDEMLNLSSRKAGGKPANYEYWLWLIPLKKYKIVSNIIKLATLTTWGELVKKQNFTWKAWAGNGYYIVSWNEGGQDVKLKSDKTDIVIYISKTLDLYVNCIMHIMVHYLLNFIDILK